MEQDPLNNKSPPQSTIETARLKRPYNKISQELRSQILHALTIEKLPLQQVADKFQTKPCTCKAILLTYEQEGRREKKTSRRERVEIESRVKLFILDPLGRENADNMYLNVKQSKMYSEEKDLCKEEELALQKKLVQEVNFQLGEIQTSCYHVQQNSSSPDMQDEHTPENIIRGINMSLHVISSKIREIPLVIKKKKLIKNNKLEVKELKPVKQEQSMSEDQRDLNIQAKTSQVFQDIQQFLNAVIYKTQNNPLLMDQFRYLTNETILQMSVQQRIQNRDLQVRQLQRNIKSHILQFFRLL